MKPSAAKKDERPCKKPSAEEEQVEPAAVETVLNEAEAGVKATRNPLAQLRDLGNRVVDLINKIDLRLGTNKPISMPVLLAKVDNLNRAWSKFVTQHDRLCVISRRGRLLGLQAYYADLEYWYRDCIEEAKEAALKEEQTMRAVLDKVVMVGGGLRHLRDPSWPKQ